MEESNSSKEERMEESNSSSGVSSSVDIVEESNSSSGVSSSVDIVEQSSAGIFILKPIYFKTQNGLKHQQSRKVIQDDLTSFLSLSEYLLVSFFCIHSISLKREKDKKNMKFFLKRANFYIKFHQMTMTVLSSTKLQMTNVLSSIILMMMLVPLRMKEQKS